MGINIDIRIELSATQKKVMRAAVVTSVVISALGVGLAVAAPHQWAAMDLLKASEINALSVIDAGANGRFSVGPTVFCGPSNTPTDGSITGGYFGAKGLCEKSTACGTSATAHMCSAEEMTRSRQLNIPISVAGWYAGGVATKENGASVDDCAGWTFNGDDTYEGALWNPGATNAPERGGCKSRSLPVLCCD